MNILWMTWTDGRMMAGRGDKSDPFMGTKQFGAIAARGRGSVSRGTGRGSSLDFSTKLPDAAFSMSNTTSRTPQYAARQTDQHSETDKPVTATQMMKVVGLINMLATKLNDIEKSLGELRDESKGYTQQVTKSIDEVYDKLFTIEAIIRSPVAQYDKDSEPNKQKESASDPLDDMINHTKNTLTSTDTSTDTSTSASDINNS